MLQFSAFANFPVGALLLAAALLAPACGIAQESAPAAEPAADQPAAPAGGQVVVYTALDRQFSEPILALFKERTGIEVMPVYDSEAVKTVGLVNRLLAERERPRADVFWNNEILRSIQLKNEGLTESYVSPSASGIPDAFKDAEGHWTGFAARARVILVNTNLIPEPERYPRNLLELTNPRWKGQGVFAKPLFGTTNTHAVVQWAMAGEDRTKEFWTSTIANARMEAGNAQARDRVVEGAAAWCYTDTDDAYGAILAGAPVAMVYPDEDLFGPGALLLPNTLVLIKGGPNPDNGRRLIDFLLSEEVEGLLAASPSAQIPLRSTVTGPANLPPLPEELVPKVDWQKAYEAIAPANAWLATAVRTP